MIDMAGKKLDHLKVIKVKHNFREGVYDVFWLTDRGLIEGGLNRVMWLDRKNAVFHCPLQQDLFQHSETGENIKCNHFGI